MDNHSSGEGHEGAAKNGLAVVLRSGTSIQEGWADQERWSLWASINAWCKIHGVDKFPGIDFDRAQAARNMNANCYDQGHGLHRNEAMVRGRIRHSREDNKN